MQYNVHCYCIIVATITFTCARTPLNTTAQLDLPKSFSLTQVRRPRAYRPGALEARADTHQNGSVQGAYYPQQDDFAFPIQIGTPPQNMMVLLDTGHSDTWVFASGLWSPEATSHNLYDPRRSSTSQPYITYDFAVQYNSGQRASGDVYADTVTIGGVQGRTLLAGVEHASEKLTERHTRDGIVGLALGGYKSAMRPNPVKSWFKNIKGSLSRPLFAACMRHNEPSSFDFGKIDQNRYTGTIGWADTIGMDGLWTVRGGACYVDGRRVCTESELTIDTGSGGIFVPKSVAATYYDSVMGAFRQGFPMLFQGLWLFPCTVPLPDFSVDIAGARRTVPGYLLNLGDHSTQGSVRYCIGGVQVYSGRSSIDIVLGMPFLKRHYVIFDGSTQSRVGFAEQVDEIYSASECSTSYYDTEEGLDQE